MDRQARIRAAIDRLASALTELGYTDVLSIRPAIRLLLAPGEATTADAPHMHAIGITPELAELIADAVTSLTATRNAEHAEFVASLTPTVFALAKPELAADIDSAFAGIDLDELTRTLQNDSDNGEDAPE